MTLQPIKLPPLGLAYLGFVSLGLPDGALGVAWPSVREDFALQQSGMGFIQISFAFGFFVSSTLVGHLLQRLGVGKLLAVSTGLVTLALSGYVLAPTFPLFLAWAVVLGLGSCAIDAALNTHAVLHFTKKHLYWLHAAFVLGSAVGPFIMTAALATSLSWRGGYLAIAAITLLMSALFIATHSFWHDDEGPASSEGGATAGSVLQPPPVLLQMAIFFVYTGVEMMAGAWIFTLLTEARGLSTASAGLWTTLFWVSLFVGRIVLGLVADEVWPGWLARLGTLGALVGSLALALAPIPIGLASLLLLGFSLAPIYPALMSLNLHFLDPEQMPHAVSFQVNAAMLGALVFPTMGGLLAEDFGLEATAMLIAATAGVLWLLVLLGVSGKPPTGRPQRDPRLTGTPGTRAGPSR